MLRIFLSNRLPWNNWKIKTKLYFKQKRYSIRKRNNPRRKNLLIVRETQKTQQIGSVIGKFPRIFQDFSKEFPRFFAKFSGNILSPNTTISGKFLEIFWKISRNSGKISNFLVTWRFSRKFPKIFQKMSRKFPGIFQNFSRWISKKSH